MRLIRVGTAVVNQIPLAWAHNTRNILDAIEEARARGVTLLCFPELCIPGYGCEDAFYALNTIERSWRCLEEEILPATKGMIVSLGLPTLYQNGLFNTACLVADGKILGLAAKHNLAGDGIYYEPRWFRAWPQGYASSIRRNGQEIPIGDLSFDVGGIRIGYEICEDAWVAQRPGGVLSLNGADIIMNPSGSHFAFDKFEIRQRLVLEGSRAFGVAYLYTNLMGNEAGRAIYDGGDLIAVNGKVVAQGPRFSYNLFEVTDAVVDVEAARMLRTRTHSFKPSFDDSDCVWLSFDFDHPEIEPELPCLEVEPWEESEHIKEEEFTRAVTLALFDYMRKSWSRGFVISLSGGADSAACAVLCGLMVRLGVKALGRERFLQRLAYIPELSDCADDAEMVRVLLTTAYQATRNSGDVTRTAAREVAAAVGAEHFALDIDGLVEQYTSLAEGALGRDLTWDSDDIALQNIQARVRGPSVWMLANVRNALLIATSNRSEAAVGYTTMDGDTCGGLSPIAGIDKDFLRRWLRWMEVEGPDGFGPIPALSYINDQQPTAELRPSEEGQTDEGDLMPYDLLDAIERVAIGERLPPVDVFRIMRLRFPQYSDAQLHTWITRFFRLFSRNQWKRERFAPSFHLDDKNLDPKTWCRWPILSGGFREDLEALDVLVASRGEG